MSDLNTTTKNVEALKQDIIDYKNKQEKIQKELYKLYDKKNETRGKWIDVSDDKNTVGHTILLVDNGILKNPVFNKEYQTYISNLKALHTKINKSIENEVKDLKLAEKQMDIKIYELKIEKDEIEVAIIDTEIKILNEIVESLKLTNEQIKALNNVSISHFKVYLDVRNNDIEKLEKKKAVVKERIAKKVQDLKNYQKEDNND